MDQYEVTRTRWDTVNAWATNHGYTALTTGEDKGSNHPVRVAWWIAARWCNARSEMEGLVPCYYTDARQTNVFRSGQLILQDTFVAWSASGYRLPTEAEWEKAARGGATGRRFPWSDTNVISHARANYTAIGTPLSWDLSSPGSYHPTFNDGVWPYTNPVDWFPAYGYGLYGMAGNVSEWCWDAEGDYPSTPQSDPHGPDGATIYTNRIVRGGSFNLPAGSCAVARRTSISPGSQGWGVRCVRVMPP
jgi:formylglycine-generating enzyme required for sulfatase activity